MKKDNLTDIIENTPEEAPGAGETDSVQQVVAEDGEIVTLGE